jgi:peptidoglycan/LPS O-acetylase OafA/YrhL
MQAPKSMGEAGTDSSGRTAGSRYTELDSLRGLAACTVVLHHLAQAYSFEAPWYLRPLVAGHEAVILFFTLSGFVLSLPFWRRSGNGPYAQYFVRRFFRIYVPFAVAIAVATVGAVVFAHTRLPLGTWFYKTWQTDVTPGLVGRQLMLWPGAELNTAFWSLRFEVQMSLVFPLVLLGIRHLRSWVAMVLSCGAIYMGWKLQLHATHDSHFWMETMEYGAMFVAGAVLARQREHLRELWNKTPRRLLVAVPMASALLYSGCVYGTVFHHGTDLLTALGACGLILSCMYWGGLRRVLHGALPRYLGRVSFSLYLVHGTVLFALLDSLYGRVPLAVLGLVYAALALAFAHVFCVAVEEPAMRLGRRLASMGAAKALVLKTSDST